MMIASSSSIRRAAYKTVITALGSRSTTKSSPVIMNNNVGQSSSLQYFSSVSVQKHENEEKPIILVQPPNLKIDPRAVSSPFYNLTKKKSSSSVNKKESLSRADDEDDDTKEYDSESPDDEIIKDYDIDNEDEATLYELTNETKLGSMLSYVVPLPERLHVPILHISTNNQEEGDDNDDESVSSVSSSPIAEKVGTIHLSESVFGQDPIRTDILHRCVIYLRNKKRGRRNAGAITKTISTKSGSGRKVRPQKGGGRARAGHSRPAHWRGGAKAHGPKGKIQNYETKLNKKVRRIGARMALSQKLKEGNLILVNGWDGLESYKTKYLAQILEDLGDIGGRYGCTAYVVDHVDEDEGGEDDEDNVTSVGGIDVNLKVASRNLYKVKVSNQRALNVYDILKYEKLVMSLSALQAIEERYAEE